MTTLLILAVTLAVPASLALAGWHARPSAGGPPADRFRRAVGWHLLVFAAVYFALLFWACDSARAKGPETTPASPAAEQPAPARQQLSVGDGLALIGVALATGLSVLGAGYAVAVVGAAALGALAEKPELFGRTLVFIGLAEGLAIYGLIMSILMLGRLG
jgi:V/A-type H+-transporting ATPase subunit K